MYNIMTTVNTAVWYIRKLLRVDFRSYHKEKKFFFSSSLYEMMDKHKLNLLWYTFCNICKFLKFTQHCMSYLDKTEKKMRIKITKNNLQI